MRRWVCGERSEQFLVMMTASRLTLLMPTLTPLQELVTVVEPEGRGHCLL